MAKKRNAIFRLPPAGESGTMLTGVSSPHRGKQMVGNQRNMGMNKKSQEPMRDLGALASLRASMEKAGAPTTPAVTVPPEPIDVIVPDTGGTPAPVVQELTPEAKAAARRAREAERKRLKRQAEKASAIPEAETPIEPTQDFATARAEGMEPEPTDEEVDAALDAHVAAQIEADGLEVTEVTPADIAQHKADVEQHAEAIAEPVVEPAPAPIKQPLDVEQQQRRDLIGRIVSFFPEQHRAEEEGTLTGFDRGRLQEIDNSLTKYLGEPDGHASELHKAYLGYLRDPAVTAAVKVMDKMGGEYDKKISQISRIIADDVLTNSLTTNNFRTAARDHVNMVAVLRKIIVGDLEPVLRRYINPETVMVADDPRLPTGMGQLLGILRHAAAHLSAAVSRDRANEAVKQELLGKLGVRDDQLKIVREKLEASERKAAEQFVPIPDTEVFVYCRNNKKFLANHMLPTGRNPEKKKVSITQFFWTDDLSEALHFGDREHALRTVDNVMQASIGMTPQLNPTVAGQSIANVSIADVVIRLPTE